MQRIQEKANSRKLSRIVMLADWLPPDFGAVGQYAVQFARELAAAGHDVTLVGFTSAAGTESVELFQNGTLRIRRVRRGTYDRSRWTRRLLWTLAANFVLVARAIPYLRRADEIRFTGSPPYLIHFIAPIAILLRRRTRYRITDFHPECLIAAMGKTPLWLGAVLKLTRFWRRRVDMIEVLGEDQALRLRESGIPPERLVLKRDPSPVTFGPDQRPAAPPASLAGRKIILYSGNWGIAHDWRTFVEGFEQLCSSHPDAAGLWLNATGKRADIVENELRTRGLPFARTQPVPLIELAGVLLAADVHLITLTDSFVGYVLPSKVYACVASQKPVLFVGDERSDVHLVCTSLLPHTRYARCAVGDATSVARSLRMLMGSSSANRG
jgi:glycosyltransferase involved in cell wall biosynthesis